MAKNPAVSELGTKHGFPVYDRNPSVPVPSSFGSRPNSMRMANGERVMIVGQDTGEILGEGHAGFFEMKEVDEAQFVKLYLAGVKSTANLTASGLKMFEIVYMQLRDKPQADRVEINQYVVKQYGVNMPERTYHRGLRELLEHNFLYRSPSPGVFFVNVGYIFNGNRITLAKTYYKRGAELQGELPFQDSLKLEGPTTGDE